MQKFNSMLDAMIISNAISKELKGKQITLKIYPGSSLATLVTFSPWLLSRFSTNTNGYNGVFFAHLVYSLQDELSQLQLLFAHQTCLGSIILFSYLASSGSTLKNN